MPRVRVFKNRDLSLLIIPAILLAMSSMGCDQSGQNSKALNSLVRVSMRSSALDATKGVLQLHNQSSQALDVILYMENLDNRQDDLHRCRILPGQTQEVGVLETNWAFVPNDPVRRLQSRSPNGRSRQVVCSAGLQDVPRRQRRSRDQADQQVRPSAARQRAFQRRLSFDINV